MNTAIKTRSNEQSPRNCALNEQDHAKNTSTTNNDLIIIECLITQTQKEQIRFA